MVGCPPQIFLPAVRPAEHVHKHLLPGKGTAIAPPPGKRRMIIYSLCDHCAARLDELTEVIEARIESDLRASGVI